MPQAPFQTEIDVDAGRTVQTTLDDGNAVQLNVEAGEIKSNGNGQRAVQQLSKLFAVLERVICAISVGENATWKDGASVPPALPSKHTLAANASGVAYSFLGRVVTSEMLELKDEWSQPKSTGVRFLRPDHVHFVSIPLD